MSQFDLEQARALLAEVRANRLRLEACRVHHFKPVAGEEQRILTRRYRCSQCEGTVSAEAAHWYDRGLKDAP